MCWHMVSDMLPGLGRFVVMGRSQRLLGWRALSRLGEGLPRSHSKQPNSKRKPRFEPLWTNIVTIGVKQLACCQ